ncbi:hypothetical protein [Shewanella woodyi]|uniref:hypothetical protein n=1 Tax=Shewanella woodyi TaxID=60961 RepID=UPI0007F88C8D|nr:hypothetical protein [Shewanella woodyi]
MVKKLGLTFCFIIILSAIAYHFLTPKITLSNDSQKSYAALNFTLPNSQITFSPIPSHSRQSIYFSPQKKSGLITYQLVSNTGVIVAQGQLNYQASDKLSSELGNTLTFTIGEDYRVSFQQ